MFSGKGENVRFAKRRKKSSVWSDMDPDLRSALARSAILVVGAAFLLLTLHWMLSLYYFGGTVFGHEVGTLCVAKINVKAGETITRPLLLSYLNLKDGMPLFDKAGGLFGDDVKNRQSRLMKASPTLKEVAIARRFSGQMYVTAIERTPVARFRNTRLVVDKFGVVFVRNGGVSQLPFITGLPVSTLSPGNNVLEVPGMAAALEFLEAVSEDQLPLRTSSIMDVGISQPDFLNCSLVDRRVIKLAWKGMGEGTPAKSRKWLDAQVLGTAGAMASPSASGCTIFDATRAGHCYAR